LSRIQAELIRPETVSYIVGQLTAALRQVAERTPGQREALIARRDETKQKVHRLVAALEHGAATATLLPQLQARESELGGARNTNSGADRRAGSPPTTIDARLGQAAAGDAIGPRSQVYRHARIRRTGGKSAVLARGWRHGPDEGSSPLKGLHPIQVAAELVLARSAHW
jgi:hypothetical protein